MNYRIKIIFASILTMLLVVGAGCASYKNSSSNNSGITVGAVLDLTGKVAPFGENTKDGMDLALREINTNSPGAMKIIYENSETDPSKAVSACQKLISINKVPALVGLLASDVAMACAPLANQNKIIMLSTLASTDKLKDAGDYFFRIREGGAGHSRAMANYVFTNLKRKKAALFYTNSETGINYSKAFGDRFKELGGVIVYEEAFADKTADYRSELAKLKDAQPEVVYMVGLPSDAGVILKQARELNVQSLFVASPTTANNELLTVAGPAAEGLIFSTPAFDPGSDNLDVKNFVASYQASYHKDPDFSAANGYDAIKLLYQVMKEQGNSPEAIKSALYQVKNYPGVGGAFSFDSYGEVSKQIMLKKVEGGKFVTIQ